MMPFFAQRTAHRINKKTAVKTVFAVFMAAYSLWLLYMLFFRNRSSAAAGPIVFGVDVKLIPFRTTSEFIEILRTTDSDTAFRHGVRNLAGNIVLFIPFGLFLPVFFKKCRGYAVTLLCSAAGIITVELAQLATRRGICDIDDLIFNLAGVSAGYLLYRAAMFYLRSRKEKNQWIYR